MPEANFDPYHKWLGVPPEEQPPNHYRLLGIQIFESDPDVIESAATRQTTHVRSFAIGKHGELTQAILNEIAEAKLCLLLPERKRKYDNSLNKPHSADQPVATVSCPACDASLAINKTLYGKLVKCPKCTATCRISVDGKEASAEPGANISGEKSLFDALPKSETQPSGVAFTGVAGPKRKSTKVSRKKKSTLNWIAVVAVPTGAICGIALAVVLLWVLFKKDPLGIMVADAPVRQSFETAREPSTSTNVNPEATKAPDSRLGKNEKAGRVQQTNGPRPSPAVAPFDAAKAKQHQDAWADYLGVTVENTNSIGMKFVVIPPGEFMMNFYYKVRLTEPFHFGMHEVTQEQYQQVMGNNPSQNPSSHNPVEQVSWKEALDFCRRLSSLPEEVMAGNEYRLPTEAEWEYACRAGSTTKYSFGDSYTRMSGYGWAGHNSGRKTHPVGQKKPNPWGLYDVHGNVWEWCHDRRGDYPSGEVVNPTGASSGHRVYRGGGCGDHPKYSESGVRNSSPEDYRRWDQGFRVIRTRSDQTLKRQDKRTF